MGASPALAGPDGANVVGGAATVSGQGGAAVIINQSSDRAIINWNTFNVGAGESARFNQPSASSITLNRVVGGLGPSQINGTVSANGRIFLINRDGILFGPTATVDTAGFLATTHDIRNDDFMAGRFVFGIPGNPEASIVNQGTITAHNSGFAALVAPGVRNTGTITATLGTVSLASGNGFTLDFYGDRLITLGVTDSIAANVIDVATGQPLSSLVKNEGVLRANGGRVEMTAATARRVVDSVINNTGTIEANTFRQRGGTIVLSAGTGATKIAGAPKQTIRLSGTLSASAKKRGKGGKIIVTAENIEVVGARIDVSGKRGGGTVLIGGDWSGGNPIAGIVSNPSARLESAPVATATTVSVDGASIINASATGSGNGGKVIVWSDQTTTFAGTILARGGAAGGDGGFVETSGHQVLNFTGNVDTRAPNGAAGTLLLDPYDVTISTGADSNMSATNPFTPSGNTSVLNVATLQNALALGNVLVTTGGSGSAGAQTGNITVANSVTWSSASTLTLSAYNNISFNGGAVISNTGAGSLILRADNSGIGTGYVSLNSGSVDFSQSTGKVSIYFDPIAGYTFPTYPYNYGALVTTNPSVPNQVTAYMLVNTPGDLPNIATNTTTLGYSYALGHDIDATTFGGYAAGTTFTGTFDGNGGVANYTISNIKAGLFPFIGSAGIARNLTFATPALSATGNGQFLGSLAGENDGTITNVTVTGGTVAGGSFTGIIAGGLVGQNRGTITQATSSAAVSVGNGSTSAGGFNYAGGLAGINMGTITSASASGTIVGGTNAFIGGLIGENGMTGNPGTVTASSASGNVTGGSSAGGLVGFNASGSTVANDSASGNVSAPSGATSVGGLVGQNEGTVTNGTRTAGTISGTGVAGQFVNLGGLVGFNTSTGTISNSSVTNTTVTGTFVTAGGLVGSNSGLVTATSAGQVFVSGITLTIDGTNSNGGGLAGWNNAGATIHNAAAGGTVGRTVGTLTGTYLSLGGLAGHNSGGIDNSTSTATVNGGAGANGGFVGQNEGTITTSTASGNVGGTGVLATFSVVGGFVGVNNAGGQIVSTDSATGIVSTTGFAHIGGLIGDNSASLSNLSAGNTVNASGSSVLAGGLIGVNNAGATLTNVQAFGNVTAATNDGMSSVGGLIGSNLGTIVGTTLPAANASCASGASFTCASGAVSVGTQGNGGGLIGFNQGSITNAFASGVVSGAAGSAASGQTVIGGLVGENSTATITGSYATGAVAGTNNVNAGGLVGDNFGTITNSYATGKVTVAAFSEAGGLVAENVGGCASCGVIIGSQASGTVTGGSNGMVAGLVVTNSGTLTNVTASGGVNAADNSVLGGLVALNLGSVTGGIATGAVTSTGVNSIVGGFVGLNPRVITSSTASGPVTAAGQNFAGGFAGLNFGLITQSSATATAIVSTTGAGSVVGGFVGLNAGTIDRSSAAGAVNGGVGGIAGGLVGANVIVTNIGSVTPVPGSSFPTGTITASSATGAVTGGDGSTVGGLIGANGATITGLSTASSVTGGANSVVGGLVGANAGPSFTPAFPQFLTTCGSATCNLFAVAIISSAPGSIVNSSASGPVTGGSFAIVGGLVGENDGAIAQSSASGIVTGTGAAAIGGLVGYNDVAATISNSTAGGNVTGGGTSVGAGGFVGYNLGTIADSQAAGAVSGAGLVGGFVGFNVGTIDPSSASGSVTGTGSSIVGGFAGANAATITQASATGPVTGGDGSVVGGLVGENIGQITQGSATGTVTGGIGSMVGGLVGGNLFGTIANSSAGGAVSGGTGSTAGGLVGSNFASTITNSFATGNVTGGATSNVGGFVGSNFVGTISGSYATGNVSGASDSIAGGFVGTNTGFPVPGFTGTGAISASHATGNVTGGDTSIIGGFFGINLLAGIDHSYATGTVTGGNQTTAGGFGGLNLGTVNVAFASGPVTGGNSSFVGGFVGVNYAADDPSITTPTGVITQSYAFGPATAGTNSFVAAFAAVNVGSLDQTLATGFVTGGAGSTTGGLVASNNFTYVLPATVTPFIDPPGTATNSYWDTQSTGQTNSAGGTGEPTSQLVSGLPAGFDPAVWAIAAGQSYPFLKDPAPTPTPIPSSIPSAPPDVTPFPPTEIATLPFGTPIYPTQQLYDQWRDPNLTPTVQAALVTAPAAPTPSPAGRSNGNGNPPPNGPRVSGVPPIGETRYIQDQVVFRVCGDVPAARVAMVARRLGMTIISAQRVALIDCTVYQYRITDKQSVSDKIRKLEALRLIAAAQPNYVFALAQTAPAPAPPALAQVPPPPAETPPPNEGDPAQYLVAKLRLPEVHRIARGTNVRVAVIDSEIDGKHPDLEGTIMSRFDAVGAEDKPHPHGTGMAGAIVSHKRLIGIAPGVQVLAVHAFGAASTGGQGTTMQIVKGLDWAVSQGARVVNMSFAGPKDPMLQQAVKVVHDKGIVLFAAAGNAGPKSPPLYPGADPNVIAVTATDEDDKSYTGANRGKYIAIAAPGVDVLVPAPDGTYQLTTGTSVATAEVSGVAALLLEKDPKLTPDEIRSILTSTAKKLGTQTRDDEFGYGLVDPYKALTSLTAKQTSLEPERAPAPERTAAAR